MWDEPVHILDVTLPRKGMLERVTSAMTECNTPTDQEYASIIPYQLLNIARLTMTCQSFETTVGIATVGTVVMSNPDRILMKISFLRFRTLVRIEPFGRPIFSEQEDHKA